MALQAKTFEELGVKKQALVIRLRIKELCEERGITHRQLASATGLREADVSELANNTRTSYNKEDLRKLIEGLQIEDMNELFQVIWRPTKLESASGLE